MSKPVIDARGLSCPEPVLLAKQALKEHGGGEFVVKVNTIVARDNVLALLQSNGRAPKVEEKNSEWLIEVAQK